MAPQTPRVRDDRGAITWVGAVLLLGIATGAYLAWVWIPVYVVHYEVEQVVRQFGAAAIGNRDDGVLVEQMTARIRALHEERQPGPDGQQVVRPLVDVRPQDVTWERSDASTLHVAFDYDREIPLPFLDRKLERVMNIDLVMDVSSPRWGASP